MWDNDKPEASFHDQWLSCEGDALQAISDDLAQKLEAQRPGRKRKDAIERRRFVADNIIANLTHLVLSQDYSEGKRLAISTAKNRCPQYDRPDYPKNLIRDALGGLERLGMIHRYNYIKQAVVTTVEPSEAFLGLIQKGSIALSDIHREKGAETIWVFARIDDEWRGGEAPPKIRKRYLDTAESIHYRKEMKRINKYLKDSEITYDGQFPAPIFLRRNFLLRKPDDPIEFKLNGRLSGGFWMNLPKEKRYKLLLNGQEVADLDFSSMFAHLAYLRCGERHTDDDPYDISGLEDHRDGAKLALLSLLSRSTEMRRLTAELKKEIPEGWTAKRLRKAIAKRHPRIAHLFGTDIGIDLMFTESQILVAILLKLADLDIPALPMHDGLMVPKGDIKRVLEVMGKASIEVVGEELPIKEKPIKKPTES